MTKELKRGAPYHIDGKESKKVRLQSRFWEEKVNGKGATGEILKKEWGKSILRHLSTP